VVCASCSTPTGFSDRSKRVGNCGSQVVVSSTRQWPRLLNVESVAAIIRNARGMAADWSTLSPPVFFSRERHGETMSKPTGRSRDV